MILSGVFGRVLGSIGGPAVAPFATKVYRGGLKITGGIGAKIFGTVTGSVTGQATGDSVSGMTNFATKIAAEVEGHRLFRITSGLDTYLPSYSTYLYFPAKVAGAMVAPFARNWVWPIFAKVSGNVPSFMAKEYFGALAFECTAFPVTVASWYWGPRIAAFGLKYTYKSVKGGCEYLLGKTHEGMNYCVDWMCSHDWKADAYYIMEGVQNSFTWACEFANSTIGLDDRGGDTANQGQAEESHVEDSVLASLIGGIGGGQALTYFFDRCGFNAGDNTGYIDPTSGRSLDMPIPVDAACTKSSNVGGTYKPYS